MNRMKTKDILEMRISGKANCNAKVSCHPRIIDAIHYIPEVIKTKLIAIGEMQYHSEEQKKAKESVPFFCFGGEIPIGSYMTDKNIVTKNPLMIIDIDKKDNESIDLESVRKQIFDLPYVIGIYKSISRQGYWVLIYVEDLDKVPQYQEYISKLWKQNYNINTDLKTRNISRQRVISYNEDWMDWTKGFDYELSPWSLVPVVVDTKIIEEFLPTTSIFKTYERDVDEQRVHDAMIKCANSGYYVDSGCGWYHLACECKNFKDGLEIFGLFSRNHPSYRDSSTDIVKKYNQATATGVNSDLARKWIGMLKRYK